MISGFLKVVLSGAGFMLLVGCGTLDQRKLQHLDRSSVHVPEALNGVLKSSKNLDQASTRSTPWWDSFDRSELSALIDAAFDKNLTLAQATARLEQAHQVLIGARSGLFANLDLTGGVNRSWEGSSAQDKDYDLGFSVSWQPDVFKRSRRSVQVQRYQALNQQETAEAVRLSLSGEIAETYFAVVAAHRRLTLLELQAELDTQLQDLLQLRFDQGVGTRVDVLRQQARVLDSRKLIPLAQADVQTFENQLDVLLGETPDSVARVTDTQLFDLESSVIPQWLPVDLLMNRPDLRALRAQLMAEDVNVSLAIARRLPSFNLTGSWLYQKDEDYRGPRARFALDFVQPLLYWGRLQAEQKRSEAVFTQTLALFAHRYLQAIEEVEALLIQAQARRVFLARQYEQLQYLKEAQAAAQARYQQGLDNYLGVIDALTSVRTIEREIIIEQLNLINTEIRLHLALGSPTGNRRMDVKAD